MLILIKIVIPCLIFWSSLQLSVSWFSKFPLFLLYTVPLPLPTTTPTQIVYHHYCKLKVDSIIMQDKWNELINTQVNGLKRTLLFFNNNTVGNTCLNRGNITTYLKNKNLNELLQHDQGLFCSQALKICGLSFT